MIFKRLAPLLVLFVAAYAAGPLSVDSQWSRVQLPGGIQGCKNDATGEVFNTGYVSRQYGAAVCSQAWKFLTWWWANSAEAANFRKSPDPGPDGVVDTSCDGAACAATLACNDTSYSYPSLSGLITNTNAVNENVRARFSGAGAAGATLSIITLSGDDPAVNGWSISGDNLVNAGTDADLPGSGSIKIRGTSGADTADCSPRNWSYVAPPSSDTVGPNPVTNIASPTTGVGTVTLTHDATDDPDDGTPRTGVAEYCYYRDAVEVDCDAAATAGLVNDFTFAGMGTCGGSPGAIQTGASWALTGCGAGLEGGSDNIYVGKRQVSFGADGITIRARASAMSDTATYNKVSAYLAAQDAANSIAADCTMMNFDGVLYVNSRNRTTTGGNRFSAATSQVAASFQAIESMLHYDSAGLDCAYNLNGGPWIYYLSNYTDAVIPSTAYAGVSITPTSAGANNTATLDYISITTSPVITKVLTVSAGQATFTARAKDVDANLSTVRAGVVATPGAPSGAQVMFQPGVYANHNKSLVSGWAYSNIASDITNEICPNSYVQGFVLHGNPGWFVNGTNAASPQYGGTEGGARGFNAVDTALAALAACSTGRKYLVLSFQYCNYGGLPPSDASPMFPVFVLPLDGQGGVGTDSGNVYPVIPSTQGGTPSTYGYCFDLSDADNVDLIMDTMIAYCNRYKDDDSFYGINFTYTNSYPFDPGDIDLEVWNTAQQSILTAERTYCPTQMIRQHSDWANPNPAESIEYEQIVDTIDGTLMMNDTIPHEISYGEAVHVGDVGGVDYRGAAEPWVNFWSEVETPEMCGHEGWFTPSVLWNHMRNGTAGTTPVRPTHIGIYMAEQCDAITGTTNVYDWDAWKIFLAAQSGATVFDGGASNTPRTPAYVIANICPFSRGCE